MVLEVLEILVLALASLLPTVQTGDSWFTAIRALNVENGPLD
jgi:hypothetical protein